MVYSIPQEERIEILKSVYEAELISKAKDIALMRYSMVSPHQKNGFDALLPSSRSDEGTSRKIDPDLEEQIRYPKTTHPRMSSAAIFRQLCTNGSTNRNKLSESTVNRFLNNLALKEKTTNNLDMCRYERAHVNEVWCDWTELLDSLLQLPLPSAAPEYG